VIPVPGGRKMRRRKKAKKAKKAKRARRRAPRHGTAALCHRMLVVNHSSSCKVAAPDPRTEFSSTARDTVPSWIRDEQVLRCAEM